MNMIKFRLPATAAHNLRKRFGSHYVIDAEALAQEIELGLSDEATATYGIVPMTSTVPISDDTAIKIIKAAEKYVTRFTEEQQLSKGSATYQRFVYENAYTDNNFN